METGTVVVLVLMWLMVLVVTVQGACDDIRLNSGGRVPAVVISVTDGSRTHPSSARVHFTTLDGEPVDTTVFTGFFSGDPDRGDHVRVAYDRDNPTDARILGADDLFDQVTMLTSLSLLLLYVIHRRRSRSRTRPTKHAG